MGMEEVISKQLHKPAIPIAFGIISLLIVSGFGLTNTEKSSAAISALNKSSITIKKDSSNGGLVSIQVKEENDKGNIDEIGRAADYYFKFN